MMTDHMFTALSLCTGNPARSIFAQSIVNRFDRGKFLGCSAGSHSKGPGHPIKLKDAKKPAARS